MKSLMMSMMLAGAMAARAAEPLVPEEIALVLRVVVDEEGKANVRSGPSRQSKVTGQVVSGSVVSVEPHQKGEWIKLLDDDGGEKPRYIHMSRLQALTSWTQSGPGPVPEGTKAAAVKQEGWTAQVKTEPFVAADHKITRDAQGIELVDGESPWGRDGGLPAVSFSLTVSLDGQPVTIPREACRDLYEPGLETLVLLTPVKSKGQAVILMSNGDGAGAYCVAWAFKDGKYAGREVFVPY